jgi:hypothetical protein
VLGRHRLLCGDSTVATDVERVLGGVAPHLMVTDGVVPEKISLLPSQPGENFQQPRLRNSRALPYRSDFRNALQPLANR